METYWTSFDTAETPVIQTDILVIGSGAAGLQTAWSLAEAGREVLVVARDELQDSNTAKAQGGIAAALGQDDDPARIDSGIFGKFRIASGNTDLISEFCLVYQKV